MIEAVGPSRWIIWYAAVLHAAWAVLLIVGGTDPFGATALSSLRNDPRLIAVFLLATSAAAAWATTRRRLSTLSMLAIFPQLAVMLMSALPAVIAVIDSEYADGVKRPHAFIMADQLPIILIVVLYVWSLMSRWARMWREGPSR